jgi:hypothetical protein
MEEAMKKKKPTSAAEILSELSRVETDLITSIDRAAGRKPGEPPASWAYPQLTHEELWDVEEAFGFAPVFPEDPEPTR